MPFPPAGFRRVRCGLEPAAGARLTSSFGLQRSITYCVEAAAAIFPQPPWKNRYGFVSNRVRKYSPKGDPPARTGENLTNRPPLGLSRDQHNDGMFRDWFMWEL